MHEKWSSKKPGFGLISIRNMYLIKQLLYLDYLERSLSRTDPRLLRYLSKTVKMQKIKQNLESKFFYVDFFEEQLL